MSDKTVDLAPKMTITDAQSLSIRLAQEISHLETSLHNCSRGLTNLRAEIQAQIDAKKADKARLDYALGTAVIDIPDTVPPQVQMEVIPFMLPMAGSGEPVHVGQVNMVAEHVVVRPPGMGRRQF